MYFRRLFYLFFINVDTIVVVIVIYVVWLFRVGFVVIVVGIVINVAFIAVVGLFFIVVIAVVFNVDVTLSVIGNLVEF